MSNSIISKKDPIVGHIFGCVNDVQMNLGMGLHSDAYRQGLVAELELRSLPYAIRPNVQAFYRGNPVDHIMLVPDILVASRIPINVVAMARDELREERRKIRSILTLGYLPFGFVINFDEVDIQNLVTTIQTNRR